MKKIIYFLFVPFYCWAVNPPTISPLRTTISYGGSVTLSATGCSGTVIWSNNLTATSIVVSPKQSAYFSATCTENGITSKKSANAIVQVNLSLNSGSDFNITAQISGTGVKYAATNTIIANNKVESDASVQYNAGKSILLNPAFEAKTGSLFLANLGNPFQIATNTILSNLNIPWEILWGPDNFIWMTQRGGTISRVNPNTGEISLVATIPDVYASGEGGLLGMVLHPDFVNNPYIYIVYNYFDSGIKEKVVRYTYNSNTQTISSPMLMIDGILGNTYHDGSRLVISADLKLFISTGDAGHIADPNDNLPQNDNSLNGKILRLNLDGTIPADNPISGNAMWCKGQRNPQGLVIANGKMYSSTHGTGIEDEINIIQKGGNFGWPNVEGYCDLPAEITFCAANSVIEPIKTWSPTVATSGLDYYNNVAFPRWQNSLLLATLKQSTLFQLKLSADGNSIIETNQYLINQFGRLRDIAISPDGRIFICTSNGGNADKLVEITPFEN
jgi:aldose sugar dehydrogenase